MIYGVDVSAYQVNIQWGAVKAAGKDFAVFKVAEGLHYVSPVVRQQIEGTLEPGIVCAMIYLFARLGDSAVAQGKILGKFAREFGIRPALDVETQPAGMSLSDTRVWMAAALDACDQECGQQTVLYSYFAYLEALALPEYWGERPLWLAEYPKIPTPAHEPTLPKPWTTYTFWQYGGDANKATCPGISHDDGAGGITYADLNVWPGSIESLGQFVGVSPMATTDPAPASTPTGH